MPMPSIVDENDTTFTVDHGDGGPAQQVAKTPDMMAPGGVYDQLSNAPAGVGAPPPTAPTMDQGPAPGPQAPTDQGQPWTGSTGTFTNGGVGSAPPAPTQPLQQAPIPAAMPNMSSSSRLPQMVPVTSTTNQVSQSLLDPTMLAKVNADTDRLKVDTTNTANQQSDYLKTKADLEGQAVAVHQQAQTDAEKHQAYQDHIRSEYEPKMKQAMDDYMNAGIKPKSLMEDGNLGQNIAAGLSIGLGALGAAMLGNKENGAVQIMQTAIDRDLQAQKANLEKKSQNVNMLGVAYKAAREMGMDDYQASEMARSHALQQIQDKITSLTTGSQSDAVKLNGQTMSDQLEAEKNKAIMNATAKHVGTTTETQSVPITKLLGEQKLPETFQTKASELEHNDRAYKDVADAYEAAYGKGLVGPLQNRWQELARKFSIQATSAADLQQKLKMAFTDNAHQLFGSRFTDAEGKAMDAFFPDANSRPEVFRQNLATMWKKNAEDYRGMEESHRRQRDYDFKPSLNYEQYFPSNSTIKK